VLRTVFRSFRRGLAGTRESISSDGAPHADARLRPVGRPLGEWSLPAGCSASLPGSRRHVNLTWDAQSADAASPGGEVAEHDGKPMQNVLDEAIEQYRRDRFFRELDESYARLQADSQAWQEELDDRCLWEPTLADGLDGE